jgi:hypothetical protein
MLLLRAKLKSLIRDTRPNFKEIIRLQTKGLNEEEKAFNYSSSSKSTSSSSSSSLAKGEKGTNTKRTKKTLKKKEVPINKTKQGRKQTRQIIVKEKVKKTLLDSWPLSLFKFRTNAECKSSKRSASYFVSKSDLIEIIQKDAELSKMFPKNYKSKSKDELCDVIVPLEKEKEKENENSDSEDEKEKEGEGERESDDDKSSILSFSSSSSSSSSKSSNSSKSSKSSMASSKSSKSSIKSIKPFAYFKNENNSCYIDSLFVSLMHHPNLKLMKTILDSPLIYKSGKLFEVSKQIKVEMQRLWDEVISSSSSSSSSSSIFTHTCSRIRQLFQKFDDLKKSKDGHDQIDWIHDQQEPLDVINLLNEVFKITDTVDVIEKGNWRMLTALGGITVEPDGKSLLYQLANELKTTIVSAPFDLYIHVNRTHVNEKGVGVKNRQEFNFPFTLSQKNKEKDNLILRSVIVHQGATLHGGHYIAHLKMEDNKWRTYDDTRNTLSTGRTYLSRANDDTIKKNCVALIYCNEKK